MLEFGLHEFRLGNRFYVLLPKLGRPQSEALAKRLTDKGFAVRRYSELVASKKGAVLHVNPAGFCWSNVDSGDALAPAIPGILALPKETTTLEDLRNRYFALGRSEGSVAVRFSTRMESSSLWEGLRTGGECGLTPDELAVASSVIGASRGGCRLLTDFPAEGSKIRIVGKRQYYESSLDQSEAASTLRPVGQKGERNSHLPREGILLFESLLLPPREKQLELFNGLGEWCCLRPD